MRGDLWWAVSSPFKLAGTSMPSASFDFAAAFADGLTHLVSLHDPTELTPVPLSWSTHPLQDLYHVEVPTDPAVEWERVKAAATEVRWLLDSGEGVLVHCLGGTGRTGTVIGAVLGSYGLPLDHVAGWLDQVQVVRGQRGWPESEWQRRALAVLQTL